MLPTSEHKMIVRTSHFDRILHQQYRTGPSSPALSCKNTFKILYTNKHFDVVVKGIENKTEAVLKMYKR